MTLIHDWPWNVRVLCLLFTSLFVATGSVLGQTLTAHVGRPKYDCSGGLRQPSKQGEEYVAQAINDALDILKNCEPCRRLFDADDPDYAIRLLTRLRQDDVFVISLSVPVKTKLSVDLMKLTVIESKSLGSTGAVTRGLSSSSSSEVRQPCIYINAAQFMVTGQPAEGFALYGLEPRLQRAAAVLHELAHVAGVIQYDGDEDDQKNYPKSAANTNCVRSNCLSCKAFQPCPNAPAGRHPPSSNRHRAAAWLYNSISDGWERTKFGGSVGTLAALLTLSGTLGIYSSTQKNGFS